jgi:hypothetical protein
MLRFVLAFGNLEELDRDERRMRRTSLFFVFEATNMTAKQKPQPSQRPVIRTGGEVLADGAILEPIVTGASSDPLKLAFWNGSQATIAPRIEHRGMIYEPAPLEPSVLRALYLPSHVAPAESAQKLIDDLSRAIVPYTGLSERCVVLCTRFALATWEVMNFSTSPWLSVVGSDTVVGTQLLRLLKCFCKRALPIGSASLASICAFPPEYRFTFLIHEAQLSRQTERLLQAVTRKGQFIPFRGRLLEIYTPVVTFTGEPCSSLSSVALPSIEIPAIPSTAEPTLLTPEAERQIARDFQPRLLGYFFRNNSASRTSPAVSAGLSFAMRELGRNLASCTPGDESLQTAVLNALKIQDQASQVSRWTEMNSVIIESVLSFSHADKNEVYVGEICDTVTDILRERDGDMDFKPKKIGTRLRLMQLLPEPRDRRGYRLLLTGPVRRRVHELAFAYGVPTVQNGLSGCPLCKQGGQIPLPHDNGAKKHR